MLFEDLEDRRVMTVVSPGGEDAFGVQQESLLQMQSGDTLKIELGGNTAGFTYDQVNVAGSAKFDGTLLVELENNFNPVIGTRFDVVTSVGSSGVFSQLELPTGMAEGKRLVPVLARGGLSLVVAPASRPTGGSQLRVPVDSIPAPLQSFLGGVPTATSVSLPGVELTVLNETVSGDFSFGAGPTNSGLPVLAASATNVTASLGDDLVSLTNGEGTFFLTSGGVAAAAAVDVAIRPDLDVSFSGTVGFAINTHTVPFAETITFGDSEPLSLNLPGGPYVRMEAQNATLGVTTQDGEQTLGGGSFVLEATTITENTLPVRVVRGFVDGASAALGDPTGPRVQLSGGHGGFVLRPEGIAAQFQGDVDLLGVSDDLELGGQIRVGLNNTGIAVNDSFTMSNGQAVAVDFTATGTDDVISFGADLDLTIADFVDVHGSFDFRKQSVIAGAPASLLVGVDNVSAFFGTGFESADETGVRIDGGKLGLILQPPNQTSGDRPYALTAQGSVEVVGVEESLTLGGTLKVRKNTTGGAVDETIGGVPIVFSAAEGNLASVTGTALTLGIRDQLSVTGNFAFTKETSLDGLKTTITAGAAGVNAFVGADDGTGVSVSNGELGLIVTRNMGEASKYAMVASGAAALTLPDVTLLDADATLQVRLNQTGAPVPLTEVSVPLPDGGTDIVEIEFSHGNDQLFVGGTLNLGIGPFTASGGFSFAKEVARPTATRTDTKLLVGATNVKVGLDAGPFGFHLDHGKFGFVSYTSADTAPNAVVPDASYAFDASGTAGIDGLPVSLSGNVGVRLNTTNVAVNETVSVPDPITGALTNVPVVFATGAAAQQFTGTSLTLGVAGIFTVAGDVTVTPGAGETDPLKVRVANAGMSLYRGGEEAITLGGALAEFELGGTEGFVLKNFGIGGYEFAPTKPALAGGGSETPADEETPGATNPPTSPGTKLGPLTITSAPTISPTFGFQGPDETNPNYQLNVGVDISNFGATLDIGTAVSVTATNVGGSFGAEIELGFDGSPITGFTPSGDWNLTIGHIDVTIASVLTLFADNVAVNPNAQGAEELVSFGEIGAKVKVGPLDITGSAKNFAITGAGNFRALDQFGVSFSIETLSGVGLPSFLPLKSASVSATWTGNNFESDPGNFTLLVSAAVDVNVGPVRLAGSVDDLEIDTGLLRQGRFPITSIGSVIVSASGPAFGGTISGSFIAGLIKLDADGERIDPDDTNPPPVADRQFYSAIQAGFTIPGVGAVDIRFGLDDDGPLNIYLKAGVPVPLGPTGLVLTDFRASVQFDAAPLPGITDPRDLLSPSFSTMGDLTDAQWQAMLEQQVVRRAGGSGLGYLFDLAANLEQELNGGTVNATLHAAILAQSLNVETGAPVQILQGNRWLIEDGSSSYLVEKRPNSLAFSRLLTTIPEDQATGLDSGSAVPEEVAATLEAAGYLLGQNSTVDVITAGQRWEIADGDRTFIIRAEGGVLAVTGRGSFDIIENTVRIEAGATVYHAAISQSTLSADADVIITTDGKFVIRADINAFGGLLTTPIIFYADLSNVEVDRLGDTAALHGVRNPRIVPIRRLGSGDSWAGRGRG